MPCHEDHRTYEPEEIAKRLKLGRGREIGNINELQEKINYLTALLCAVDKAQTTLPEEFCLWAIAHNLRDGLKNGAVSRTPNVLERILMCEKESARLTGYSNLEIRLPSEPLLDE